MWALKDRPALEFQTAPGRFVQLLLNHCRNIWNCAVLGKDALTQIFRVFDVGKVQDDWENEVGKNVFRCKHLCNVSICMYSICFFPFEKVSD